VLDYTRSIRDRYGDGARLDKPDAAFMADLLQRHPASARKIGCGITGFSVSTEPVFKTRCFRVHRLDGSSTDFSFRECVTPTTRRTKVMHAFRTAITGDIIAFRDRAFAFGPVTCPHTGRLLTPNECHVDHKPPTFATLVAGFMKSSGMDFETIPLIDSDSRDNMYVEQLADTATAVAFLAYHRKWAVLEIIAAEANTTTLHEDTNAI
jgi:hypothetical protein